MPNRIPARIAVAASTEEIESVDSPVNPCPMLQPPANTAQASLRGSYQGPRCTTAGIGRVQPEYQPPEETAGHQGRLRNLL